MRAVSPKTLGFDHYTLDLQSCALMRGNDEVQLRPKSFDVLRYLAEHAGRLVSKDELIHAVWPDLFVTEDSVVQCIGDIRAALRDDAHRIIKTVPRRGYLFAAELSDKQRDGRPSTTGSRAQVPGPPEPCLVPARQPPAAGPGRAQDRSRPVIG